jgi:hypothetical protein
MSVKFSPLCQYQPNFNVRWYLNVVHVCRQMIYSLDRLRKIEGKFIECWEVLCWIPYKRCIQLWHQFTCNLTEEVRILVLCGALLHSAVRVDVTGQGGQRPKDMLP